MIEQLKNCPSCGGILTEAGRCQFCGSKVYDFLALDCSNPLGNLGKTYIRLKYADKIYIAPIMIGSVVRTYDDVGYTNVLGGGYSKTYYSIPGITWPTFKVEFRVVNNPTIIEDTENP